MTLLETKSLCIGYPRTSKQVVLQKDINMSVSKGEIVSIMGQNGVGKTTLTKQLPVFYHPFLGVYIIEVQYFQKCLQITSPNR